MGVPQAQADARMALVSESWRRIVANIITGSASSTFSCVGSQDADTGAVSLCHAAGPADLRSRCTPTVARQALHMLTESSLHIQGVGGQRSVPLTEFYVLPGDRPDIENVLEHGELITHVEVPLLPVGARSGYLKVRDRASYEFALTSAAAALVIKDGTIAKARLALGGVGTIPWRARQAEEILNGSSANHRTFRAAAETALRDPFTVSGTAFKVELA